MSYAVVKEWPTRRRRRLILCGLSTVKVHMTYWAVTRIEANVHVLSRKVVRDSVRGISESRLGLRKTLMADDLYHHSKGGSSVCMVFSMLL